jgi:hypothetical protein
MKDQARLRIEAVKAANSATANAARAGWKF